MVQSCAKFHISHRSKIFWSTILQHLTNLSEANVSPAAILVVLVVIVVTVTKLGTIVEKTEKERKVQMAVEGEMVVQAVTAVIMDHLRKGLNINLSK